MCAIDEYTNIERKKFPVSYNSMSNPVQYNFESQNIFKRNKKYVIPVSSCIVILELDAMLYKRYWQLRNPIEPPLIVVMPADISGHFHLNKANGAKVKDLKYLNNN